MTGAVKSAVKGAVTLTVSNALTGAVSGAVKGGVTLTVSNCTDWRSEWCSEEYSERCSYSHS